MGKDSRLEGKLLSQVGKEILLKVVVQAIPIFAMSCFLLPVSHWKKLLTLCQPKDKTGLGFKDLCKFMILTLYFTRFLRQNIFQIVLFLKQKRSWVICLEKYFESSECNYSRCKVVCG